MKLLKQLWSIMAKQWGSIKFTTSTRFWFAFIAFFINMIIFTVGLFWKIDPTSLGTGLALVNTPLYGYIFGATVRPAQTIKESKNEETNQLG